MRLAFESPAWLWLALAALPVIALGAARLRHVDRGRRVAAIGLRVLLVVLLAGAIAGPVIERRHDAVTVIGVIDASASMRALARFPAPAADGADGVETPRNAVDAALAWFDAASAARAEDDRVGLVTFDGAPLVLAAPSRDAATGAIAPEPRGGSDLEAALRLARALLPADGAGRIVLVSDGAETRGDALAAPTDVPIDVLPVAWTAGPRVRVARLDAPPRGRPGARVPVRIELAANGPVAGTLRLRREGAPIDLDPAAAGDGRRVAFGPGAHVETVEVELLDRPINRLEATFAPDEGARVDLGGERALAVVVTAGRGRVLIATGDEKRTRAALGATLERAGIGADVVGPSRFPDDLLDLQAYDLVVLDDVAAAEMPVERQAMLVEHVESFGAGLLAIGGPHAFGAGGWNGSPVEALLPLELDPPRQVRAPEAALVLVIDRSGSMRRRVAGARASQMEIAARAAGEAVATLRRDSLVGVVTFAESAARTVPLGPNDDPDAVRERIAAIAPEGGTNLAAGLETARSMLAATDAARKHVVCLTDGQAMEADFDAIAARMRADGITVSTIAIGDEADQTLLRRIAELGEGTFHPVLNPRSLPRVLVDSVRVVDVPLVKEGAFVPVRRATGSRLGAELASAPPLGGLVVTAPRDDPRAIVEATHPDGEPLLAQRRSGLGLAIAFTADAGGPWSSAWSDWSDADAFWLGLVRAALRPPGDPDAELLLREARGTLEIELAQTGAAPRFDAATAVVLGPDGARQETPLVESVPGRWIGAVPLDEPGVQIVSVRPERGERALPPVLGALVHGDDAETAAPAPRPALLAELAARTGGRTIDDPATAGPSLFDRAGLAPRWSLRPSWWPVALAALMVFLLDLAARRIAWRTPHLATIARDALREVERAPVAAPSRPDAAATTTRTVGVAMPRADVPEPPVGSAPRTAATTRAPARPAPSSAGPEPPAPETIERVLQALRSAPPGRPTPPPAEDGNGPPSAERDAETGSSLADLRAARARARGATPPPPDGDDDSA